MQGAPIEAMPGHRRGGATPQTGPRRRNPKGARGLRPLDRVTRRRRCPSIDSSSRLASDRRSLARDSTRLSPRTAKDLPSFISCRPGRHAWCQCGRGRHLDLPNLPGARKFSVRQKTKSVCFFPVLSCTIIEKGLFWSKFSFDTFYPLHLESVPIRIINQQEKEDELKWQSGRSRTRQTKPPIAKTAASIIPSVL